MRPKFRKPKPGTPGDAAYREGGNFIIYTLAMVQHPAFVFMSYVCSVLIKYLEAQYLSDGGTRNGQLTARYTDLQRWGLYPDSAKRAIDEAVRRKLVVITAPRLYRGYARSDAAQYRLTHLRWPDENGVFQKPTDDWKQYQEPEPKRNSEPATQSPKLRVVLS